MTQFLLPGTRSPRGMQQWKQEPWWGERPGRTRERDVPEVLATDQDPETGMATLHCADRKELASPEQRLGLMLATVL